jgi:porphobilinogen synthase
MIGFHGRIIEKKKMLKDEDNYYEFSKRCGLCKKDMIFPLFVDENDKLQELNVMPGLFKVPYNDLIRSLEKIVESGIHSVIIFGIPRLRNNMATSASSRNGIVQKAVRLIKSNFGNKITTITDVCICQYNKTGHCGLLEKDKNIVDNDLTIELLADIALSHAMSGVDIVAPSSMMDGQIQRIKEKLDTNGYKKIKILSFSAKQSSSLYKPFRSETFYHISANEIDKSTYQVPFYNPRQIEREIEMDIQEGSNMVMIKPAMSSLDLVYRIKKICQLPIVVQIVSGEYSIIKAGAAFGFLDETWFILNLIAALKRSGADMIISYSSLNISKYLL